MSLAKRLKVAREKAGLSQIEVAERLHISRQAISKWENGWTSPDIDNLVILSDLYSISLDELLKDDCDAKNAGSNLEEDIKQNKNKLFGVVPEEVGITIVVMCLSTIPCLGFIAIILLLSYCTWKKYVISTLYKVILLCFILVSAYNSYKYIQVEFLDKGEVTIEKVASNDDMSIWYF